MIGFCTAFSWADVIDVTDTNHPVELTPRTSDLASDAAARQKPKASLRPRKTPGPPAIAAKLEGTLVQRNLVRGSPTGPLTEIVAEALEIKRAGKVIRTIRTPMFIREWHFVNHEREVEVCSGPLHGPGVYQLYDLASGRVLLTARDPLEANAPRWAADARQALKP